MNMLNRKQITPKQEKGKTVKYVKYGEVGNKKKTLLKCLETSSIKMLFSNKKPKQ